MKNSISKLLFVCLFSSSLSAEATLICDDPDASLVGSLYNVGESVSIIGETAEVVYLRTASGEQVINDANFVEISPSRLAGNDGIELHLNNAGIQINFNQPAKAVFMSIAQNTGPYNKALISNLGINGEDIQMLNGFASTDGLVLGKNAIGQVIVSTNLTSPEPQVPAIWISDLITFSAESGAIESISIAGQQLNIDDICFHY